MKKSKKIVALALSTFSLAQPAFQSCYAMSNGEDQSMLQSEGEEAKTRKDFLKYVQSIISDKDINTSSAIYEDFKEKAKPFKGLQFDHQPWQWLLYIIERRLDPEHYEFYLNAKREPEESGEPFTCDDRLHNELLCYGFTKDEIKIVDELLNKARDLHLKEEQDLKREEAQNRKNFLECLQGIISDKSVNTSSAIYEAFKTRTQQFKDLQLDGKLFHYLLIRMDVELFDPEDYLNAKRKSEESREPLNYYDKYLHDGFLDYGFTEDEIEIVDELLNKARDLYLKEKKAILKAKPEFLKCLQGIISDKSVNTSSAIYEAFKTRTQQFKNLQPGYSPWELLLYNIEFNLGPLAHECDPCKEIRFEKSGKIFTFSRVDSGFYSICLSCGFTEDEIKIVDKLLSEARDLYLEEKKANKEEIRKYWEESKRFHEEAVKRSEEARRREEEARIKAAEARKRNGAEAIALMNSAVESTNITLSSLRECFRSQILNKFLDSDICDVKKFVYDILDILTCDYKLNNYDYERDLSKKLEDLSEDDRATICKFLLKAKDAYSLHIIEREKRYAEEKAKKEANRKARQFIVDRIKKLLAMENITSKSILGHLQAIAYDVATAPLRAELKHVYENFPTISKFWEEGSLGKITGEAFKALKALWEEYRKIQAEEKAKKEAEEKARKEAEEKAQKEAEEKAQKEAKEKAQKEAEEKAQKEAAASQEIARRLKEFKRDQNTPLAKFRKVVDTIYCELDSQYPTFRGELSVLKYLLTDNFLDSSDEFNFESNFGPNADLCGAVKKFVGEAKARRNTERRKEIQKRADRSINEKKAARRGKKGGGRK